MVQYNKCVVTDTGTYSIDYFTFDFLLLNTIRLFDLLVLEIEKRKSSCIKYQHFQSKHFLEVKEIFQCDSLHVELFNNKSQLRLSFNPNHCVNSIILAFLLRFVYINCSVIAFRVSRCDFTYDIPVHPDSVMVLTRKNEGHLKSTRYYGVRGTSGYLRLYDKRSEEQSRFKFDSVGHDLTRLEWEVRNEQSFKFDQFSVPDFSSLSGAVALLKFVAPENYNAALLELDKRTRKKVKDSVFTPYPFEPEFFFHLKEEYLREYGLQGTFPQAWPSKMDVCI